MALEAAGFAGGEEPFDEAVAVAGLGAVAGLAPHDEGEHRLRDSRGSLPADVLVTAPAHPLMGARLGVEGRTTVGGVRCLVVRLPDGTPGTIAVAATSAGGDGEGATGALLTVGGVRVVRRLLDAVADRSGT